MKFQNKFFEISTYILLFSFTVVIFIMGARILTLETEKDILIKRNKTLKQEIAEKDRKITKFEIKYRLRVDLLQERVGVMHKFMKKIYPYYDYQEKFDQAVISMDKENFNDKLLEMPDDLFNVYIEEYKIKEHGVQKYEKTLKNMVFPMDKNSSFVSCKEGEFGVYRPYINRGYRYVHLGSDFISLTNNSVYAVYDMIIWKKYYTESSGFILEAKILYENEEGEKDYYFVRYMHLVDINDYVKEGEKVKKGTVIATMGNTGYLSTAAHCHLELWKYSKITKDYYPINFVKNSTYSNNIKRRL